MAKNSKEDVLVNVGDVYTRTEQFVDRNRKLLALGLGGVAVLFVLFFAWQYLYKNPREKEAANIIWKAQQWMEAEDPELALSGDGEYEGFEDVIEKYSGTRAARLAHFYSGVIYRDKGDFETALGHFLEADFNDETVGVLAMGNAGDMYVELDKLEEGAKWLERAARAAAGSDARDFLGPMYLLKSARAYMELGKDNRAKGLLQQVTDNFDTKSPEYNEAAKLLAMLKARD